MKTLMIIATVTLVSFLAVPYATLAQVKEKKVVESKSSSYEKTRGANENVTKDKPSDDTKASKPEKTRGELCQINIFNSSAYAVDIYVDGEWKGTIRAYSTAVTFAIAGTSKFYGWSVGHTKEWGPWNFDCTLDYSWNLYD
jgi:hypothetical protein